MFYDPSNKARIHLTFKLCRSLGCERKSIIVNRKLAFVKFETHSATHYKYAKIAHSVIISGLMM